MAAKLTTGSRLPLPIAAEAEISGATYVEAWDAAAAAATVGLGAFTGDEPAWDHEAPRQTVPLVTNRQAAALVHAWLRATARSRVAWRLGLDLGASTLGWRKPGDKFDMSAGHQMALLPRDLTVVLWLWTYRLATELDANQTVVRPLFYDARPATGGKSAVGYEELARVVYNAMKQEGLVPKLPTPTPPVPAPPVPPPFGPKPGAPSGASSGFPWWLLLVGALFRRRRRRR